MIANNFVKKENVLSGEKGFEDQFTDETIIDAFKTYCKNFNLEKLNVMLIQYMNILERNTMLKLKNPSINPVSDSH